MMGIGYGSGENRALDAATQAINSNLLEASIQGASRVLFSIAGGPDLTLATRSTLQPARWKPWAVDEDANIIYGQIIDEGLGDQVRITIIATGLLSHHAGRHGLRQRPQRPVRLHGAGARHVHVEPEPSHVSGRHVRQCGIHPHRRRKYIPDFVVAKPIGIAYDRMRENA